MIWSIISLILSVIALAISCFVFGGAVADFREESVKKEDSNAHDEEVSKGA